MSAKTIAGWLTGNPYPGRGVLLGRAPDNRLAAAYFIMGRSPGSRNRVFAATTDGIETQAFDPSLLADPSLIIYHPVRALPDGRLIVTNGDQTDTLMEYLARGEDLQNALMSRTFEPDPPIFTPRISGVLEPSGAFWLSILKSADGDAGRAHRFFFHYEPPAPGAGRLIHTYAGDGAPPPSFEGEPRSVTLTATTARGWAEEIWASLDKDNRVSLFTRLWNPAGGEAETCIINANA
jgi:IMP cyclohydrolase